MLVSWPHRAAPHPGYGAHFRFYLPAQRGGLRRASGTQDEDALPQVRSEHATSQHSTAVWDQGTVAAQLARRRFANCHRYGRSFTASFFSFTASFCQSN